MNRLTRQQKSEILFAIDSAIGYQAEVIEKLSREHTVNVSEAVHERQLQIAKFEKLRESLIERLPQRQTRVARMKE